MASDRFHLILAVVTRKYPLYGYLLSRLSGETKEGNACVREGKKGRVGVSRGRKKGTCYIHVRDRPYMISDDF